MSDQKTPDEQKAAAASLYEMAKAQFREKDYVFARNYASLAANLWDRWGDALFAAQARELGKQIEAEYQEVSAEEHEQLSIVKRQIAAAINASVFSIEIGPGDHRSFEVTKRGAKYRVEITPL